MFLKNKIVKTKSNANNSKTQLFFLYSKTMSSTFVNNLKQHSIKKNFFYLFMIFQASKFKTKKVAKINIWIKKINHFEIVKFDLFYRYNFVSMIFIETFKVDNSITYQTMKNCLFDQKYFKKKIKMIIFTNDKNRTIQINNELIFQNLWFFLKKQLSKNIKLQIIDQKNESIIN